MTTPWECKHNAAGYDYWINAVTGARQWEAPENETLYEDWTEYYSEKDACCYYYNTKTHETSWTLPENSTLNREDTEIIVEEISSESSEASSEASSEESEDSKRQLEKVDEQWSITQWFCCTF